MVYDVRGNSANVYYIKKKLAINMQNLALYEASDGLFCSSNVHSEIETYAVNLTFI